MHFGEIRGTAMLAGLLAIGIFVVDRVAPAGMSRPGQAMDTAIAMVDRRARQAAAEEEAAAPLRGIAAAEGGSVAASPLTGAILAGGYACPTMRRVSAISGGNGVYRVVCALAGGDRAYRVDTRHGIVGPDPAA